MMHNLLYVGPNHWCCVFLINKKADIIHSTWDLFFYIGLVLSSKAIINSTQVHHRYCICLVSISGNTKTIPKIKSAQNKCMHAIRL